MTTRRLVALALILTACSQTSATTTTLGATQPTTTTNPTTTTTAPTTLATSSTTTAPTLPDPPSIPAGSSICDIYSEPTEIAEISDIELIEVSGIAASRTHEGLLWAVNDSGGGPIVYGIADGDTVTTVQLNGVFPIDWEDLAIGPAPDGSQALFVGDVGDNLGFRPWVSIFRFTEPSPDGDISADPVELELVFPDVEGVDTEAIAVDPITGDILVIPKSRDAVGVYRAPGSVDSRWTMERIATLDLGAEITAAAFSPSGDRLVLRGYKTIWMWPRTSLAIEDVIATAPCEANSPTERQGEALTIRPDNGVVTISEGGRPPVNLVPADG